MSSQQVYPTNTTGSNGFVGSSALTLSSTLTSQPPIFSFLSVPEEFLQKLKDQKQDLADLQAQTEDQLAKLFGQISPWVQTTLEAFKAKVKGR